MIERLTDGWRSDAAVCGSIAAPHVCQPLLKLMRKSKGESKSAMGTHRASYDISNSYDARCVLISFCWNARLRGLEGECSLIPLVRRPVDFFEDQLADLHSRLEANVQGSTVPDFQADVRSEVLRVIGGPKTGMDRRSRHLHTDTQAPRLLALRPVRQAQSVGQPNQFSCPAQDKSPGFKWNPSAGMSRVVPWAPMSDSTS